MVPIESVSCILSLHGDFPIGAALGQLEIHTFSPISTVKLRSSSFEGPADPARQAEKCCVDSRLAAFSLTGTT